MADRKMTETPRRRQRVSPNDDRIINGIVNLLLPTVLSELANVKQVPPKEGTQVIAAGQNCIDSVYAHDKLEGGSKHRRKRQ